MNNFAYSLLLACAIAPLARQGNPLLSPSELLAQSIEEAAAAGLQYDVKNTEFSNLNPTLQEALRGHSAVIDNQADEADWEDVKEEEVEQAIAVPLTKKEQKAAAKAAKKAEENRQRDIRIEAKRQAKQDAQDMKDKLQAEKDLVKKNVKEAAQREKEKLQQLMKVPRWQRLDQKLKRFGTKFFTNRKIIGKITLAWIEFCYPKTSLVMRIALQFQPFRYFRKKVLLHYGPSRKFLRSCMKRRITLKRWYKNMMTWLGGSDGSEL